MPKRVLVSHAVAFVAPAVVGAVWTAWEDWRIWLRRPMKFRQPIRLSD